MDLGGQTELHDAISLGLFGDEEAKDDGAVAPQKGVDGCENELGARVLTDPFVVSEWCCSPWQDDQE